MKMTKQHRDKLFREVQFALAIKDIDVSLETIHTFFEKTSPEKISDDPSTLVQSYNIAKEHPFFSEIYEAQKSVDDFPGIVFSFEDETSYTDCRSNELAEETGAWDWFNIMEPKSLEDNPDLLEKWTKLLKREERDIRESMNFLYQYDLADAVFSPPTKRYHGDIFIFAGYQKFSWIDALVENYLPQIQKIDSALRLRQELKEVDATSSRTKI